MNKQELLQNIHSINTTISSNNSIIRSKFVMYQHNGGGSIISPISKTKFNLFGRLNSSEDAVKVYLEFESMAKTANILNENISYQGIPYKDILNCITKSLINRKLYNELNILVKQLHLMEERDAIDSKLSELQNQSNFSHFNY